MSLVEKIIHDSRTRSIELSPKQRFYREFDQALRNASEPQTPQFKRDQCEELERLGLKAGISSSELALRKKTILWAANPTSLFFTPPLRS